LWQLRRIHILTHEMPAVLQSLLAPCVLNENSAHGLGCSAEEVSAVVPVRRDTHFEQPQIDLVDEICGLVERLSWSLLGETAGGQSVQVVVNQRQELGSSVRISLGE